MNTNPTTSTPDFWSLDATTGWLTSDEGEALPCDYASPIGGERIVEARSGERTFRRVGDHLVEVPDTETEAVAERTAALYSALNVIASDIARGKIDPADLPTLDDLPVALAGANQPGYDPATVNAVGIDDGDLVAWAMHPDDWEEVIEVRVPVPQ